MTDTTDMIHDLPLTYIHANPQDRTTWDTTQAQAELGELARSISEHGLVQPITVRPCGCLDVHGQHYLIVAGERRFRAVKQLRYDAIRCIIRSDLGDDGAADVQLIENVNRADLDPIEEAMAYASRMERFGITAEQCADRYGKPVMLVKKRLDLLSLAPEFHPLIRKGELPVGHASAMAGLDVNRQRLAFAAFRDSKGTLSIWPFQKLCERLLIEQNQESMFDDSAFMRVQEYTDDAKKSAKIGGRALVHLAAELGVTVAPHFDLLVEAGVDPDKLRGLLDQAEQVKLTRVDAMANPKRESTAKAPKRRRVVR